LSILGNPAMRQLLVKNIKQLVTVASGGKPWKTGAEMRDLDVRENNSVLIENGTIRAIGSAKDLEKKTVRDAEILDASDRVALPGFVDSHTHLVFAGTRENEFAMRAEGRSYEEIAEQGGGILSTVNATRQAAKRDLKKLAAKRHCRIESSLIALHRVHPLICFNISA